MRSVTGNGRLEKSLCADHAGGVMAVAAKTKNAGKWHNHIIRRFDINHGDRLYDQGGRAHHPFAGTHHQSITATGPGAKTAAAYEKSANAASTSLSDAFAPAVIKAEDRGSR